jgi:hypothetical protein
MSLQYNLDLAIAYACVLTILTFASFSLVPAALRFVATLVVQAIRSMKPVRAARASEESSEPQEPWWGPHTASR